MISSMIQEPENISTTQSKYVARGPSGRVDHEVVFVHKQDMHVQTNTNANDKPFITNEPNTVGRDKQIPTRRRAVNTHFRPAQLAASDPTNPRQRSLSFIDVPTYLGSELAFLRRILSTINTRPMREMSVLSRSVDNDGQPWTFDSE